ncbi:hypothetical protein ACQPW3_34635 [Actinosynnema sp. CA-248983]
MAVSKTPTSSERKAATRTVVWLEQSVKVSSVPLKVKDKDVLRRVAKLLQ